MSLQNSDVQLDNAEHAPLRHACARSVSISQLLRTRHYHRFIMSASSADVQAGVCSLKSRCRLGPARVTMSHPVSLLLKFESAVE